MLGTMADTSSSAPAPRVLVRASERGEAEVAHHPWNPASELHGWMLSRAAGLGRIAVNLAWLPPGKESSTLHVHHREEEWLFVLAGAGTMEVDDREVAVGPGDFLGFPPGTAHHLRNTGPDDLHLLVGGEIITDVEVADFPRLRRRMVRAGNRIAIYPMEAEIPFVPGAPAEVPPELAGARRTEPPRVVVKAGERGEPKRFTHPQNPRSEVVLSPLSRPAGLSRVAVVHTRVPAGQESFVHHVHLRDEEWLYVLSGHGSAEVGDAEHRIGPGDFLGFPAGGPPHHTRAADGEDLVMVQGGDAWTRTSLDIVDFPRLGLRRTFVGTRSAMTFPLDAALERKGR
jgi:quercetin 2,3-dioxygenase